MKFFLIELLGRAQLMFLADFFDISILNFTYNLFRSGRGQILLERCSKNAGFDHLKEQLFFVKLEVTFENRVFCRALREEISRSSELARHPSLSRHQLRYFEDKNVLRSSKIFFFKEKGEKIPGIAEFAGLSGNLQEMPDLNPRFKQWPRIIYSPT